MATDDGIDFGAHRPLRQAFPYLPEDPTIPRPDQYSDLSIGDLLLVCEFWRFGALHWLRREKPDEFRRVFDSLLGRDDPAIQSMRELIIEGKVESARSAYFFSEFKFAYLTEIVVRACKGFGVDPQSVHEFLDYRDADPMSAIRAVGLLEWRLNGELTQEPTANPEHEDAEHAEPPGEQPAEKQPKAIPKNLKDIPRLDKTNGDWVLRVEAAKRTRLSVRYLANITSTSGSLKSVDGCSGIDGRGQVWRKKRENSQSVWYYVPSLSDKHS
ncbi:MAG: hypothetical protein IIA66_11165 [Planctomycetes bacterium]|nr:hypothetical protein [Planctomycetota bacterium]